MPMDRKLYPANWRAIATEVKELAGWECQECGRPCRKPGQDWCEFVHGLMQTVDLTWYWQTYDEVHDDETGEWGSVEKPQRFTLTVAHLDHYPENCDRSNLKALCSGCHLRYDVGQMAQKKMLKRERLGQLSLFGKSFR